MIPRKTSLKIRKTHRYLGVIIGIQFLAWTISGLYFSWTDIDEIHGDHFLNPKYTPPEFLSLFPLDSIKRPIVTLELLNINQEPFYWINNEILLNANKGTIKKNITEQEALAVASSHLISGLEVSKVELITKTDPHQEFRGKPLPAYAIHYNHPEKLVAYVDARNGTFQKVRHEQWRWFDFLWMGHTMDYKGRDDFNTLLLRIFSLFGVCTVLSGFLLWGTSSPTLRKLIKRN